MKITSLQNQLVKDAVSLHQKKYRDEFGLFLVEGEEPCASAIKNGWESVTLFRCPHPDPLPKGEGNAAIGLIPSPEGEGRGERQVEQVEVTPEILAKISKKDNPQPVIGVFRQRVFTAPEPADFYLALEEIRDPGNLGTIMRTAHAAGVKNILLIGPCCDAFSPEVIRASMGSFSAIHLCAMTREAFLAWQKAENLALLGTDVVDATDYRATDYHRAVIVMGNEQKGLSDVLKTRCTGRIHIPMPGGTESLNLSMATGLLLYEQFRLKN